MRILHGIAWRAAALLALVLPLVPAVAKAPPAQVLSNQEAADCGAIGDVLGVLAGKYGERVLWWGEAAGDVTMVLTQQPDTRTWTLLAVHDGEACMVSSGGNPGAVGS